VPLLSAGQMQQPAIQLGMSEAEAAPITVSTAAADAPNSGDVGAATGAGTGTTSPATTTTLTSTPATTATTATPQIPVLHDEPEPPRLSGLGPQLSDAELRGGWNLTWEVRLLVGLLAG
jgi:hypothetical protein